ncbi:uncharacterized protein [Triticum aestivum]|uniref:uncharacterized protein isoform X2 n=1 Tax=Triticum aestivum TaxID=4565 RepID=UPI001D020A87|nr:uncharacterized protein LOC123140092 isoform X2 [Triticum aestivum]
MFDVPLDTLINKYLNGLHTRQDWSKAGSIFSSNYLEPFLMYKPLKVLFTGKLVTYQSRKNLRQFGSLSGLRQSNQCNKLQEDDDGFGSPICASLSRDAEDTCMPRRERLEAWAAMLQRDALCHHADGAREVAHVMLRITDDDETVEDVKQLRLMFDGPSLHIFCW